MFDWLRRLTGQDERDILPVPSPGHDIELVPAGLILSREGLDFIKGWEKFRAQSYLDQAGIWTIGYGTIRINGQSVTSGMTCTPEQAENWLRADCQQFVMAMNQLVIAPQKQNQIDSLLSFMYNVGISGFQGSTLRRTINAQQTVTPAMFIAWNKVRDPHTKQLIESAGLTKRRQAEWEFYSRS